ncbi:MAG: hypothetical protein KC433_20725 [Anaerolineales bacterium]|nr:hypothetical protein [Anaerolineales bacterium]
MHIILLLNILTLIKTELPKNITLFLRILQDGKSDQNTTKTAVNKLNLLTAVS